MWQFYTHHWTIVQSKVPLLKKFTKPVDPSKLLVLEAQFIQLTKLSLQFFHILKSQLGE
jgi:hypothetical protein